MACRAAGGLCDHSGKAAAAAATARAASARPPAATRATTSPLNGSRSSNVPPLSALVHPPPMKCCTSRTCASTLVISSPFLVRLASALGLPREVHLSRQRPAIRGFPGMFQYAERRLDDRENAALHSAEAGDAAGLRPRRTRWVTKRRPGRLGAPISRRELVKRAGVGAAGARALGHRCGLGARRRRGPRDG